MLTDVGCRQRRQRLLTAISKAEPLAWILVADPRHLMYLGNFPVEPISWASPPPGLLLIEASGRSSLFVDKLAMPFAITPCVDQVETVAWYDFVKSPGDRRQAVIGHLLDRLPKSSSGSIAVETRAVPAECLRGLLKQFPDRPIVAVDDTLLAMRRQKDPDELALLKRSIAAGEAGHAKAWQAVRPGATELEVYAQVVQACTEAAGQPVVVYGDFCSGPRAWLQRGGPPTNRRLEAGDLIILDFSVVLGGYRGDFTNTIAVGGQATTEQGRLCDLCRDAMSAGERAIRHGVQARTVFDKLNEPLIESNALLRITGHGGHGIGLAHPEAPFIVAQSTDTLMTGDVITLEPGAYVERVGGMRFEHNYLVTPDGFERLTNHHVGLI